MKRIIVIFVAVLITCCLYANAETVAENLTNNLAVSIDNAVSWHAQMTVNPDLPSSKSLANSQKRAMDGWDVGKKPQYFIGVIMDNDKAYGIYANQQEPMNWSAYLFELESKLPGLKVADNGLCVTGDIPEGLMTQWELKKGECQPLYKVPMERSEAVVATANQMALSFGELGKQYKKALDKEQELLGKVFLFPALMK